MPEAPTVDELMALGRNDEARRELELKLRETPSDRRSLVKLGDVLMAMQRHVEAVEIYQAAAKGLASDGFHDKAIAVLHKILKVSPNDPAATLGIEQLEEVKHLDAKRQVITRQLRKSADDAAHSLDSIRVSQLWKKLSKSPVVRKLDTRTLSRLFGQFTLLELPPQRELVARGDRRDEYFMVADGAVEVIRKRADGPPLVLRAYQPGDTFGEAALLEHAEWPAAHRAHGPTRLLRLDRSGLEALLPGLEDPRAFIDTLRIQRHDASLAAMLREESEA